MKRYDFQLENNDNNSGWYYLPDQYETPMPVMVHCHGWGGSRAISDSVRPLRKAVLAQKMAFVTFDFYSCGTMKDKEFTTYERWVQNLSDMFDWIEEQEWADKDKIGCFAHSSGTIAALRFAARDKRPAFVISAASCITPQIDMERGGAGKVLAQHCETLLRGGSADMFGQQFPLPFFQDTIAHAPMFYLNQITCPVFFLQGGNDNPYRRADAFLGHLLMEHAGLQNKYLELPGGDHCLNGVEKQYCPEVIHWLNEIQILFSDVK